jgi:hypothetical protein
MKCCGCDIRNIAYFILALDMALCLAWFIIAIYPVSITCPEELIPNHVILLLHFIQAGALAAVLDIWDDGVEAKKTPNFSPDAWIVASTIALFVNSMVLCYLL